MQNANHIIETEPRPTSEFALRLATWLKDNRAIRAAAASTPSPGSSSLSDSYCHVVPARNGQTTDMEVHGSGHDSQPVPSWVFEGLRILPPPSSSSPSPAHAHAHAPDSSAAMSGSYISDVAALLPQLERLTTVDTTAAATLAAPGATTTSQLRQQRQQPPSGAPSASFKRSQAKLKQPWRRTHPESLPRRTSSKRGPTTQGEASSQPSAGDAGTSASEVDKPSTFYLPHDILLAIFSHLPSRANAQQYYDRAQPSDLLSCSRVNMAWRIAALSTIWQAIVLPDPFDRSCRRLLHLLASSHASAQITGKNYDMTEIVQRVEIDLLEATELLAEERDFEIAEDLTAAVAMAAGAEGAAGVGAGTDTGTDTGSTFVTTKAAMTTATDMSAMTDHITTLLQYVSPFRTLSIQLPEEIEMTAAEMLAKTASLLTLDAIVRGIQGANVRELDMPSPMYCSVTTFPGMLNLISNLHDLKVLVLGYSSRDWPLLKAIISLPQLENLCVFDSCWSNQIWIYLLSSLGSRLRGLTVLQGRRPLQGIVLREGIAPYCKNLTSLSIPFIQLMAGPTPVLKDADLIPIIKSCHELQTINVSGQQLLGDSFLEAIADLWSLQVLDIRDCSRMTGQNIKGVRWQSIQRVRMSGCGDISQEFMDVILQAWRSSMVHVSRHATMGSSLNLMTMRFGSVLDFNADVEDPVEMGWVRQREDEPPLDLDEDHFFADWYI